MGMEMGRWICRDRGMEMGQYGDGDRSADRMGVKRGVGSNHELCGTWLEMIIQMKSGWE